jgi:hypothetical protein
VPDRFEVRRLLRKFTEAEVEAYPAVGDGTELRFSVKGLTGSGLVAKDRLVHLVMLRKTNGMAY